MEESKEEKNTEVKTANSGRSFLDKSIDFLFSNDERKWLILIFFIGIILRIIVLNSSYPMADESVHGVHAINIINSGVINTQNECSAWFYLTDLAYKIFGIHALTSRALSLFFCSLSILVIYSIGKFLFNKRIGLIAAAILAISAFHIRFNETSMDGAMMFFVLLGFYFFIKELYNSQRLSLIALVLFAISFLFKPIVIVYMPAIVIYYFIYINRKGIKPQHAIIKDKKRIIAGVLIFLFFFTPVIAYNYILYEQKGISDVLFSRFLKINQTIYAGLQGSDQAWDPVDAFKFIPLAIENYFLGGDLIIFLLGVIGSGFVFFKNEYKNGRFFLIFHLLPFIFLLGSGQNPIHFVSFYPLLAVCGAVTLDWIVQKSEKMINPKKALTIILIVLLIFEIFLLFPLIKNRSPVWSMRDYVVSNIPENAVVVADERIYRGRIAWMYNDRAYLEAIYFSQFFEANSRTTGKKEVIPFYFIECSFDECGWGTIASQQDLNLSMEAFFDSVRNSTTLVKTFYGGGGELKGEEKTSYFNVYRINLEFDPQLVNEIYKTHEWFYYPVGWWHNNFYDSYVPQGFFQKSLNLLGKLALWVAIILSLLISLIPIKQTLFPKK
jgi:4-amino-4-deoxy-L-arabinose transferase-like glycosyltransferase